MDTPIVIQMDDPSRLAEVRRAVLLAAKREGLDEIAASNGAIVATELATNLSKHARQGEIHVHSLFARGLQGVEILSVDRGPGILNLHQCLDDGYSTAGTGGTGLGAVIRLSSEFDAYSLPGRGTIISARILARPGIDFEPPNFVLGIATRPVAGETASGDAWAARFDPAFCLLMVADGLGHGASAADASAEAVRVFLKSTADAPGDLLQQIHRALRGTRGAAVSVARIEFEQRVLRFAGLGNVAGVVVSPVHPEAPKLHAMVSLNGTAGHEVRQIREFNYAFAPGDLLVLHSDGLSSNWNLPNNPGLLSKHPSVIAGALYGDHARLRDDVCVLVGKER